MAWRARLNLVLLGLVVTAGWLVWRDIDRPPPPAVERVTALDPATIRRLEIVRAGDDQHLRLERQEGRWWLLREQGRLAADAVRVGEVLRLADAVSVASYPVDGATVAGLGLRPPRAVVAIDGQELRIGAQEPLHYRRYVETDGRVHLVQDTAYVHLSADWTAFVDPSPLAGRPELAAVAAPGWHLRRTADDGWDAVPPLEDAAARAAAWRQLQAHDVVAGVAADGAAAVTVNFVDGTAGELAVWLDEVYLWLAWRGQGVRYGIPVAQAATLGLD
jgi:hypothetical protein